MTPHDATRDTVVAALQKFCERFDIDYIEVEQADVDACEEAARAAHPPPATDGAAVAWATFNARGGMCYPHISERDAERERDTWHAEGRQGGPYTVGGLVPLSEVARAVEACANVCEQGELKPVGSAQYRLGYFDGCLSAATAIRSLRPAAREGGGGTRPSTEKA